MKEKPILFNGEMVRAILDGRKTQTRRVCKHQITFKECSAEPGFQYMAIAQSHPRYGFAVFGETEEECAKNLAESGCCPYGRVGNILWVRESIEVDHHGSITTSKYCADGAFTKADAWPWKRNKLPSIHMPYGLCRIKLKITNIRVERLQDISSEDIKAEGIKQRFPNVNDQFTDDILFGQWMELWQDINGIHWAFSICSCNKVYH